MSERDPAESFLGVLHVHTTYSDGEFTLSELKRTLAAEGCRFACLSDHAEAFDPDKLEAYRAECGRLSDGEFLYVPGLEFACDSKLHILGYGCTTLAGTGDPLRVSAQITAAGGVAVLAHPLEQQLSLLEGSGPVLHGIEAWNSKYDGRYAPRTALFETVERMRVGGRELSAFFGVDLHWKTQFRGLRSVIRCGSLDRASLLQALRAGKFAGAVDTLELPSDGRLSPAVRRRFRERHQRSDQLRRFLTGAKRVADRLGMRVPAALKNQLRRML